MPGIFEEQQETQCSLRKKMDKSQKKKKIVKKGQKVSGRPVKVKLGVLGTSEYKFWLLC